MAGYSHITTGTTQVTTRPVWSGNIVINTGFTGTLTVVDNTSGSTPVYAVITDPVVGSVFPIWGLKSGLRIIASTTVDVTAIWQSNQQPR